MTYRLLPVGIVSGQFDLARDKINHAVENVFLVFDMVIQGHGFDPEFLREFPHAQCFNSALVCKFHGDL